MAAGVRRARFTASRLSLRVLLTRLSAAMPAERRYTLFLLKTTLMKNLKHFPPLPELHRKAALERERTAIPNLDVEGTGTSTPTLHDLVLGPRAEQARLLDHVLDNAMAGQPQLSAEEDAEEVETDDNDSNWSDETSEDVGSGIKPLHRDWMDWSDKCRMLADIPCVALAHAQESPISCALRLTSAHSSSGSNTAGCCTCTSQSLCMPSARR
jgi:hypothetical protein